MTENKGLLDFCINDLLIDEKKLLKLFYNYFSVPSCSLTISQSEKILQSDHCVQMIKRFLVIPAVLNNKYVVLLSNPDSLRYLHDVEFYLNRRVVFYFIEHSIFNHLFLQIINLSETKRLNSNENHNNDQQAIFWCQQIIDYAIIHHSSDVHFECYEKRYRIRIRKDGVLYPISSPPLSAANAIANHLKILAGLDIAQKRLPQDGRFQYTSKNGLVKDCRLSVCPTQFGEKLVIRILSNLDGQLSVDDLGMTDKQKKIFYKAIEQPQGLVLVTGPTGSGKTRTLYSALNYLNLPGKNISSVEDPVEIQLPGINQVNVNVKAGLSFAKTIRSFLRQDPDIIMVGEMRDTETAAIAIRAAQTGHLVFSTLHTNSAAESITRLLNMDVAPYNIASSISLVVSQRLLRKLCLSCRQYDEKNKTYLSGDGCQHCHLGYQGRVGVFEVLPISNKIKQKIVSEKHFSEDMLLGEQDAHQLLLDNAMLLYEKGITSQDEVFRVLKS